MERRFAQLGPVLSVNAAHEVLGRGPVFLLVDDASGERERRTLMPAVALAAHLEELGRDVAGDQQIALADLPAQRWQTGRIDLQASLQEAWQYFEQEGDKALVIERITVPGISRSYGVLTRDMVERSYRY
jgi:hypothetical protein